LRSLAKVTGHYTVSQTAMRSTHNFYEICAAQLQEKRSFWIDSTYLGRREGGKTQNSLWIGMSISKIATPALPSHRSLYQLRRIERLQVRSTNVRGRLLTASWPSISFLDFASL
jgi:hypothetical protein